MVTTTTSGWCTCCRRGVVLMQQLTVQSRTAVLHDAWCGRHVFEFFELFVRGGVR